MRLVWWLAIVAAISLVGIVLSQRRALDPVQNLSLTATTPLASSLRDAARPVDDLFNGVTDRGDIARENRDLKEQLEQLQNTLASRQDAEQRVRELEAAIGVKQARPEDQLLVANVVSDDTSGLKRMIAIDRGSKDGIDEGMIVLSRGGSLVGTISRAYDEFAWVRLITDPDSSVNAQVIAAAQPSPGGSGESPAAPTPTPPPASPVSPTPAPSTTPAAPSPTPSPTPIRGVAEGDLKRGLLLDLLPADTSLPEGSLVTTSGLGGNYPRALLIGSVQSVEQRPQSPFTKAMVEPAANLSSLDTVLVLISFTPARLTEQ